MFYTHPIRISKNINKMSLSTLDDILIEVSKELYNLTADQLGSVAENLGIHKAELTGKTRRNKIQIVQKTFSEIEEDEDKTVEEKKDLLHGILESCKLLQKEKEGVKESVEGVKKSDEGVKKGDDGHPPKVKLDDYPGKTDFTLTELGLSNASILRKDFRIRGQIGESGQKDKLGWVSLKHQIKEAQLSGYSDKEIINGVINAMTPNLRLRNVLETSKELSLSRLTHFLEAHYGKQSAPDLCSRLTNMAQHPGEEVYDFVMRCIEVCQNLLLASENSTEISYDPKLVYNLFIRTLEIGIRSQYVLSEIKDILRSNDVSDEILLSAITKAAAAERDRRTLSLKKVNVSEIGTVVRDGETELLSSVKALKDQVGELKKEIQEMKITSKGNGWRPRRRSVCEGCVAKKVDFCSHCFKCGGEDHLARECKRKSGNRKEQQ